MCCSRYDTMWAGVEAGLEAVAKGSAPVDLSRFGVVGHSFGGGAAPAIAARAAARGYGRLGMWVACVAVKHRTYHGPAVVERCNEENSPRKK